MTLNDAMLQYTEQRLTRLAHNTRRAHDGQLEKWRRWVRDQTQPNVYLRDIGDQLMAQYFNRLRPPAHAESTFNNYRQYINAFWEYCRTNAWVQTNPMRFIDPLIPPVRERLRLSATELLRVLDDADSPRDRFGLATGMNTGFRAKDITALTVGKVNLTSNRITAYNHKSKKEDLFPITPAYRIEMFRWFEFYADHTGYTVSTLPNTFYLVPPMRGEADGDVKQPQFSRSVIKPLKRYAHPWEIVQRALVKLDLPTRGEGFHTLRRSAARAFYDHAAASGVSDPIRVAMSFLGHKNQATTEIYLGIKAEKERRDALLDGESFLHAMAELEQARNASIDAGAAAQLFGGFRATG